jgi:hypothetical protein
LRAGKRTNKKFKVLSVQVYKLQEKEEWCEAMIENCYFCHFFEIKSSPPQLFGSTRILVEKSKLLPALTGQIIYRS